MIWDSFSYHYVLIFLCFHTPHPNVKERPLNYFTYLKTECRIALNKSENKVPKLQLLFGVAKRSNLSIRSSNIIQFFHSNMIMLIILQNNITNKLTLPLGSEKNKRTGWFLTWSISRQDFQCIAHQCIPQHLQAAKIYINTIKQITSKR